MGDIKGILEMGFPINPLLRSHSLVSERNVGYKIVGNKNVLKTGIPKGKFILEGCEALRNVILS